MNHLRFRVSSPDYFKSTYYIAFVLPCCSDILLALCCSCKAWIINTDSKDCCAIPRSFFLLPLQCVLFLQRFFFELLLAFESENDHSEYQVRCSMLNMRDYLLLFSTPALFFFFL